MWPGPAVAQDPAAGKVFTATAPTLDGPALDAVKLRGRTLVVNFWASWCATCWAEQADLNTVPARERPLGIQFLGVDMDDSAASAQANVQQFKIGYASLVDPTNGIGRRYQIFSPLSWLFVDSKGVVKRNVQGGLHSADLLAVIRAEFGKD
jgi:thiol-disulfide isomerase/thioredoxin